MADKIYRLNSLPSNLFRVDAQADHNGGSIGRAQLLACGRMLMKEHGVRALSGKHEQITNVQYQDLNAEFSKRRALFAAKRACEAVGRDAPDSYEEFEREIPRYLSDPVFIRTLQGFDEDVIYAIVPETYTDAVSDFADVVHVGFGKTATITVTSNDIPFFSDSSWGATSNVPENRFYEKMYVLNPQPKVAKIGAKWTQLVANGLDFGQYYNNLVAGMYSKTVAMYQSVLTAAVANTALAPSNLSVTYTSPNFLALANVLSALNNVYINQLVCYGNYVPIAKILPENVTGGTNVDMDAAVSMLLGRDYVRTGNIGELYGVKLRAWRDAIVPGTQNSAPATILPSDKAYMMAMTGRKPLTIAYNKETPITLTYTPADSRDLDYEISVTTALDIVATVSSKIGVITV